MWSDFSNIGAHQGNERPDSFEQILEKFSTHRFHFDGDVRKVAKGSGKRDT